MTEKDKEHIQSILTKNKTLLEKRYRESYKKAGYNFIQAARSNMSFFALFLIPSHFRDELSFFQCQLFNSKVISMAFCIIDTKEL